MPPEKHNVTDATSLVQEHGRQAASRGSTQSQSTDFRVPSGDRPTSKSSARRAEPTDLCDLSEGMCLCLGKTETIIKYKIMLSTVASFCGGEHTQRTISGVIAKVFLGTSHPSFLEAFVYMCDSFHMCCLGSCWQSSGQYQAANMCTFSLFCLIFDGRGSIHQTANHFWLMLNHC